MDRIDINLRDAWDRISAKVRSDRIEALCRARRLGTVNVRKPLRPWCLCLRASDTRLNEGTCLVMPRPGDVLGPGEGSTTLVDLRRPHLLGIPGDTLRELMKPIVIPWPGEDWKVVARKCGVSKEIIGDWIEAGSLRVEYRVPARTVGSRGRRVPLAYTPSPIDPNGWNARPPHPMWGSAWQSMWERVPEEFEQVVERVPRTRVLRGREVFRGWRWICPGRVGPDGEPLGCGLTCNRLFAPLSPWTIPQALGDRLEIEMEAGSGLAGAWSPGFTDPMSVERSFACRKCWDVRDVTLVGPDGWNRFVTQLTGGLLYGHEVERPAEEAPEVRTIAYAKRRGRPAVRRAQVRQLLLDGLPCSEIGERLGIKTATAFSTARLVYLDAGVRTRAAFMAMHNRRVVPTSIRRNRA